MTSVKGAVGGDKQHACGAAYESPLSNDRVPMIGSAAIGVMTMGCTRSIFAVSVLIAASAAHAQDIDAGKEIAETRCSTCHGEHATESIGGKPIPTFAAIAKMPSTTEKSLSVFLTTPHPHMPELVLSRTEIRDVSAYILSLRGVQTP